MTSRSLWDRLFKTLLPTPPWYQFWRVSRFEHLRRHLATLILSILALTGLSILLTALSLSLHLSNEAAAPESIPILVELELNPNQKTAKVTRAARVTSNTPVRHQSSTPTYTLKQTKNGRNLDTQPVMTAIDTLMGEDFNTLTGKTTSGINPIKKLSSPQIITTISYTKGSTLELTTNEHRYSISNTELIHSVLNDKPLEKKLDDDITDNSSAQNHQLNIAFISNGYTNKNTFKSDAKAMYSFLLTIPPFSNYSSSIKYQAIFNQTDLGCTRPVDIPRLITCDIFTMFQTLDGKTYDTYIIIDNSNEYGGAGYLGANIAVTYRDVNALAKQVMVHEFGHSFGSLMDEYSYGTEFYGFENWPNCDYTPCPAWNSRTDCGCFQTCGYTNLYRPTFNDSLMRTLYPDHGYRFGPVSEEHLESLLQTYL